MLGHCDKGSARVQVLVDRDGSEQDREMALLGPGKLLQVSNVVGRGFSSLFNSYVGLMSAMEESRDLLLIGEPSLTVLPSRVSAGEVSCPSVSMTAALESMTSPPRMTYRYQLPSVCRRRESLPVQPNSL